MTDRVIEREVNDRLSEWMLRLYSDKPHLYYIPKERIDEERENIRREVIKKYERRCSNFWMGVSKSGILAILGILIISTLWATWTWESTPS